MAVFLYDKIIAGIGGGFGVGIFTAVISNATAGQITVLATAMTNPLTGFFVALGFGLGFVAEYSSYHKKLDTERNADEVKKD
jgi:preprotein translocase subunit SecG